MNQWSGSRDIVHKIPTPFQFLLSSNCHDRWARHLANSPPKKISQKCLIPEAKDTPRTKVAEGKVFWACISVVYIESLDNGDDPDSTGNETDVSSLAEVPVDGEQVNEEEEEEELNVSK